MGMSSGGGGPQNASPMTDINTTPLVDVMLVLLIIFMITAPLMQNRIPISIPEAANEPDSTEERAITVNVQDKGGAVLLGGRSGWSRRLGVTIGLGSSQATATGNQDSRRSQRALQTRSDFA